MASFPRTPKQLKSSSSASKKGEVSELQTSLDKLQALSQDDKSENNMLRSRIDQQSELIMMLKQRADECQKQLTLTEESKMRADNTLEQAKKSIQLEKERKMVIEKRYGQLQEEYDQLSKTRDHFAQENEQLKIDNQKLVAENRNLFSTAISERDEKINYLNRELKNLTLEFDKTSSELRNFRLEAARNEEDLRKELNESKSRFVTVSEDIEIYNSQLQAEKESNRHEIQMVQERLEKYKKDKEELTELAMKRGKLIQEKQDEISNLQKRLDHSHLAIKDLEIKFKRDVEAVSTNAQIVRLKNQLEDKERKLVKSRQEFDTYKKYCANMLKKERDINAKLRSLVDC
ncbi:Coiled-coil domain-containing protein 89 [Trichoplax sp. H2]|nr:Coiled-coil domain-containing protein 89 [Trichoplax sp. H2]|eukprot:RDD46445.1 Coiled-coil domain-containing protein 89 [Trichoplax sp. H2]